MRNKNNCRIVPNTSIPDKVRMACSKCGAIIEDANAKKCGNCGRRVKPSKFQAEVNQNK